jgi:hypothetical protein
MVLFPVLAIGVVAHGYAASNKTNDVQPEQIHKVCQSLVDKSTLFCDSLRHTICS